MSLENILRTLNHLNQPGGIFNIFRSNITGRLDTVERLSYWQVSSQRFALYATSPFSGRVSNRQGGIENREHVQQSSRQ